MCDVSFCFYFVQQHWLKVDFSRWKDEDDSDVEEDGSFEDVRTVYSLIKMFLWLHE